MRAVHQQRGGILAGTLKPPHVTPAANPCLHCCRLIDRDFIARVGSRRREHMDTEHADRSSSTPEAYHAVRFYESDRSLARVVAEFLQEGFDAGSPAIVVATPSQRGEIIRE